MKIVLFAFVSMTNPKSVNPLVSVVCCLFFSSSNSKNINGFSKKGITAAAAVCNANVYSSICFFDIPTFTSLLVHNWKFN